MIRFTSQFAVRNSIRDFHYDGLEKDLALLERWLMEFQHFRHLLKDEAWSITEEGANPDKVESDCRRNQELFFAIRERLTPAMIVVLDTYDHHQKDGHAAWKSIYVNAKAAANDANLLVDIQAAALIERLADLSFEPVYRRPLHPKHPPPPRSLVESLIGIFGAFGVSENGTYYHHPDHGYTAWGHRRYKHAPRGGGPSPPPPNSIVDGIKCECGGPGWHMPNMPVPPCACKLPRLTNDCHYCCCVAPYPYACASSVQTSVSAESQNMCTKCTHPGIFEYTAALHHTDALKACYAYCTNSCCSACGNVGHKLLQNSIPSHIPRATTRPTTPVACALRNINANKPTEPKRASKRSHISTT
jgi:hypothetical protein